MASNQKTKTPIPFSETKYWDREYKLEIVDGEEIIADYNTTLVKGLGYDPFDIKFHVVSTGGITPTFTVEILGLSQATMNKLLMWNVGTSFAKGVKIKLYAGYRGIGSGPLPLIAQGVIVQAFPISAPPEVWFRLVCITNGEFNTPILKPKYTYEPAKANENNSQANENNSQANENNTEQQSEEQDTNPDTPIKTYPADEAIEKELNVIRNKVEKDGGTLSIDIKDGVLDWVGKKATTLIDGAGKTITELANAIQEKYGVVVALTIQTASLVVYCTKRIDKMKKATPPEEAPIINAMDGLLSVGNLEYGGFVCSVTRLLNADLSIGKFCRLESKLMPGYSGRFLVTSVRYIGHYRGREWFTRLSLVKVDASDKK